MTITINQQTVEVFDGAQVKHALLRYFVANNLDKSEISNVEILDRYGHLLDHDAPLSNGQSLSFNVDALAEKMAPQQESNPRHEETDQV